MHFLPITTATSVCCVLELLLLSSESEVSAGQKLQVRNQEVGDGEIRNRDGDFRVQITI